jgi:branched-chain amino acid transport system substrate-binding protein
MKLTRLGVLGASALLVATACSSTASPSANTGGGGTSAAPSVDTSKGTIKFAIELPLQGSEKAASDPIINGVKLAVKQAGGGAGGYKIDIPQGSIYDDAVNGAHDPQQGAKNMTTLVADPDVVAVIGPLNSSVAKAQIPISNEAGVLQCSPANTNPDLTKGDPAKALRTKPNNYVRVVTTDDYQGPAAAKYMITKQSKKAVYIIDDTETFGKGIADAFEAEWKKEGQTVVAHDAAPKTTTDYTSILTAAKSKNPDSIYFGGVTATGGARILNAAVQVGLNVTFMGPDGINDGSATTKDSFLNLAGANAKISLSTLAGIGDFPAKAKFNADYKAEYNADPTGYAATGYACAQMAIDALGRAGASASDKSALREAVRAAGTDSSHQYSTILGNVKFDANGDTNQLIISIYADDPAANNGKGDWVFKEQIDFAQ